MSGTRWISRALDVADSTQIPIDTDALAALGELVEGAVATISADPAANHRAVFAAARTSFVGNTRGAVIRRVHLIAVARRLLIAAIEADAEGVRAVVWACNRAVQPAPLRVARASPVAGETTRASAVAAAWSSAIGTLADVSFALTCAAGPVVGCITVGTVGLAAESWIARAAAGSCDVLRTHTMTETGPPP